MEPDKRYFGLKAGQLLACAPRPIKQWTAAAPELWFLVKLQASHGAAMDPMPKIRNHGAQLTTKPPQAACAHQAWNTITKGEQSSEFYETLFELEGVRNEEKLAFLEQNISLALLYNIKAISETS